MPHATSPQALPRDAQDADYDRFIQGALDPTNTDGLDLNRDLIPGEKADDAIDFEDISNDDLADDEEVTEGPDNRTSQADHKEDGVLDALLQDGAQLGIGNGTDSHDQSFDDLFQDDSLPSWETNDGLLQEQGGLKDSDDPFGLDDGDADELYSRPGNLSQLPETQKRSNQPYVPPAALSERERLQQQLFALSRFGVANADNVPPPPENQEELLASLWPKFECDAIPKFMDLLPPKRARYIGKTVSKPPKPVNPTKINLELGPDHEKSFRLPSVSNKRFRDETEDTGIVKIERAASEEKQGREDNDMDSDFENESMGGITWQDLQIICEDWNTASDEDSDDFSRPLHIDHDLERKREWPSPKRRRLNSDGNHLLQISKFSLPPLHDPERATSRIARTVTLDLNDSQLLVDHIRPSHTLRSNSALNNSGRSAPSKSLIQRYNVSNDEAYDLLKESHQNKIRSQLGNAAVEHSLPATRLQWPFYKTKLDKNDARSFHRPKFRVNRNEQVFFNKTYIHKRKHLKGKPVASMFPESKDLTLADNSNILLLEYAEEHPMMMSNIGMGNKLVNYYRRKTTEDTSRPKHDIGETAVLLPQDKSPFSIFGHVDPGQTTLAIYNGIYRAPIFKQVACDTDFIVVKNTTGVQGTSWFMRNVENLYAVGQEFPSVDVPGPHSRKVTTASKNRLKMVSFRLIRKAKHHRISVGDVTSHFADSSDMQNRQKMKEFMQFNKEYKEWQMRPGESIPDEEIVRTMVRPEDVCLLESMQVGQQHLQDAGFSKDDDDSEGDDSKESLNIEQQLAPWHTSRNFLNATQGKAMLTLHGDGDPSGRGEAFSFIKTSMKGGFKAEGASANEKMQKKQLKDTGGHAYNVQEQQKSYEDSIRRIWEAQKRSLSSTGEQPDSDIDEDPIEDASIHMGGVGTPQSEAQTPTTLRRRDEDTASQFTQQSSGSQSGKTLKITRNVQDEYGEFKSVVDIIRDPRVIRQYLKKRHANEEETQR